MIRLFGLVSVRVLLLLLISIVTLNQANITLGQQEQLGPLEDQLGFSDPTVKKLQEEGMDTIGESIEFTAYGYLYHLISIMPHSVSTNDGASIDGGAVLLYKTGDTPTLVWKQLLHGEQPSLGTSGGLPSPGNWAGQNDLFFAFALSTSGSSWASYLVYIYQLKNDGSVISPLLKAIPVGYVVKSVQIQQDNTLLLEVDDIRWQGTMGVSVCCGPRIKHFFQWQSDQFVDVSGVHAGEYFEQLGSMIYALTTWKFDPLNEQDVRLYSKDLLELLMIYDLVNQREAGWKLVNDLIEEAKSTRRLEEGTYLDKVFIPAVMKSYESASPFTPPDQINESNTMRNYYLSSNG